MLNKLTFRLAIAAALLMNVSSHMIMITPSPFNNASIDNSPLLNTGAQFPCKNTGQPGFYDATGISTTMAVGENQTLAFRGSAVHGGGSCQLALTSDMAPTASSSWQVIHSIEGGCPSTDGTAPSTYQYQIPSQITAGKYVFAWTWISKEAGQPEYYMNCGPVTVTAGKSKRDNTSVAKRDALPQLTVVNQASINDCKSQPNSDPQFPNPGPSVDKPGKTPNYKPMIGSKCWPKGQSDSTAGSSSSTNSSAPADSSSPAASGASSAPASSAPASSAPVSSVAATSSPASTGTVLVLSLPPLPTPVFSTATIPAPAASTDAVSNATVSSAAASSTAADAPSAAASTVAAAPAPSGTGSASSAGALTGACTTEGMWNCLGGTSFQRCASGAWSAITPMAQGTACLPGQTMTLWRRSGVRGGRMARGEIRRRVRDSVA